MRREYLCYTDGSCKPNSPGSPGGWGVVILSPTGDETRELSGGATNTMAKVMEYRAVAEAMNALPDLAKAIVFSDNLSLVENLTKKLEVWRSNNFSKVDPSVLESVQRIDESIVSKHLKVTFQFVKSHNGNINNERADELATQATRNAM